MERHAAGAQHTQHTKHKSKLKPPHHKPPQRPSPLTKPFWLSLGAVLVLLIVAAMYMYEYYGLADQRQKADIIRDDIFYTSDVTPIPNRVVVLDTLQALYKMRETGVSIDPDGSVLGVRTLTTSTEISTEVTSGQRVRSQFLHGDDYVLPAYRLNDTTRILATEGASPDTQLTWTTLPTVPTNSWGSITSTSSSGVTIPTSPDTNGSNGAVFVSQLAVQGATGGSLVIVTGTLPPPYNSFTGISGFNGTSAYRVSYNVTYQYTDNVTEINTEAQFVLGTKSAYADATFLTAPLAVDSALGGTHLTTCFFQRDTLHTDNNEPAQQVANRSLILAPGILDPTTTLSLWYSGRTPTKHMALTVAGLHVEEITT
jgi:hypothetical protein